MATRFGNLEALLTGIQRRAQQYGLAKEAEARQRAEAILAEAEMQAKELRESTRKQTAKEAASLSERLQAQAELEAKRLWLGAREEALEQVFIQAEQQLHGLVDNSGYEAVLERLARQAAKALPGARLVLSSDPIGQSLLSPERLKCWGEAAATSFTRAAQVAKVWGGLIAECGRERFDGSFASQLVQARQRLREEVYRRLNRE
jgi:V/A-type H+-transporting ATPase subunit E